MQDFLDLRYYIVLKPTLIYLLTCVQISNNIMQGERGEIQRGLPGLRGFPGAPGTVEYSKINMRTV